VILSAAVAIWLIYSRKVPVRVVVEGIYTVIGSVLLGVLVYALYGDLDPALADVSLFSLHLWFPFLYIFLAYEARGALLRSGILYALSVLRSLPVLLSEDRRVLEGFNTLGLSYVSTAAITAVLFFLTRMKDHLRRSEIATEDMI
jgi:hypothetical protein